MLTSIVVGTPPCLVLGHGGARWEIIELHGLEFVHTLHCCAWDAMTGWLYRIHFHGFSGIHAGNGRHGCYFCMAVGYIHRQTPESKDLLVLPRARSDRRIFAGNIPG